MRDLTISTWNINSVRLRIDLVLRFLETRQPDVLCLQETKCPDAEFPSGKLAAAGYPHIVRTGIKGYNGVCFISRLPLADLGSHQMCGKADARHRAVEVGEGSSKVTIENFYVPAGGDVPDPDANPKFAHKLAFVDEMKQHARQIRGAGRRRVWLGDLNIAPLEQDVWSHKALLDVVSHTQVETEALSAVIELGEWVDATRQVKPAPEKVYSWWSYRSPDWAKADKGRRLDHIWVSRDLGAAIADVDIHKDARGWEKPSDHVPVTVMLKF